MHVLFFLLVDYFCYFFLAIFILCFDAEYRSWIYIRIITIKIPYLIIYQRKYFYLLQKKKKKQEHSMGQMIFNSFFLFFRFLNYRLILHYNVDIFFLYNYL